MSARNARHVAPAPSGATLAPARVPVGRRPLLARASVVLAIAQVALAACSGGEPPSVSGDAISVAGSAAPAILAEDRFAIRAAHGARLFEGAVVAGGDVGVVSPPARPRGEVLRLDTHASAIDGARLVAPAVHLSRKAVAGEVLTDRLHDRGALHGAVSPFVPVPAVEPLAAVLAGSTDVTVSRTSEPLVAGAYGDVVVRPGATLRLAGGEYALASLWVGPGGRVLALSSARVRIVSRLVAASGTRLAPAEGAGSARDLRIEVAGPDDAKDAAGWESGRWAVARLGSRSTVRALVSAPAGVVVVGERAIVHGALVGSAVLVHGRARILFEDGFGAEDPPAECLAGCDDANACTADACVAGACRHEPVAAGTACADQDACDGDETCDASGACLAGVAPALDDGNPCTADRCDPLAGVLHDPLAGGVSCSDADACNGLEACDGEGACVRGPAPSLDDGDACTADRCDALAGVVHVPIEGCPAPSPSPFARETEYLWGGENPLQLGVQPGAIDPALVAVVRGRTVLRDGPPVEGVDVEVFDRPELGRTRTRADGTFELAVNGGGEVVLEYRRAGHLTVQRRLGVRANEYESAPDVALVPYDAVLTPIRIGAPWVQVARASVITDPAGSRRATLLFLPGTTVTMRRPDGTVVPLAMPVVRGTETSVGLAGVDAMPADVPELLGYQYTVELSVDEAVQAGADEVTFNPPAALWVENFRGFGVGLRLPVASLDRSIAAWLTQADGQVVRLLGVVGGAAALDVDGDGAVDDAARLSALGIQLPELQQLGTLYVPGQTLWRVPVSRFGATHCGSP